MTLMEPYRIKVVEPIPILYRAKTRGLGLRTAVYSWFRLLVDIR